MEIRARHTLIGLFTLGVIAAGFLFVSWLKGVGGLSVRSNYAIRYDGPVAGLIKGSGVLFNGIRVGEVTALRLTPSLPSEVLVEVAVERATPVRADTRIGIDFQGLAGAPVVSMTGGTPTLPLLNIDPSRPVPVLIAEKNAGQGMTQAARDVLRRIDTLVADNAAPLKSLIANLDTFSGALARNSDRVDGIVAGLERLTGGGAKGPPRIFDLAAARAFGAVAKRPTGQLLISEPTALTQLDNDKIQVRGGTGERPFFEGAQWPDLLSKVIQSRLAQSFENAGYLLAFSRAPEGAKTDNQLMIDVRNFQIMAGPAPVAEVELAAKIMGSDGRIVSAKVFRASLPVSAIEVQPAAQALSDAFQQVAAELVTWVFAAL